MKFKCKQSGNVIEFKEQQDIESMLKEEGYEAVPEDKVEKAVEPKAKAAKAKE